MLDGAAGVQRTACHGVGCHGGVSRGGVPRGRVTDRMAETQATHKTAAHTTAAHKTAVVLGAGGPRAWPFHAGVLDILAESGLPAGSAELLIGTSAGSAVATATRFGATPDDLVRFITTPPDPEDRRRWQAANPKGWDRVRQARPRAPHLARAALPGGRGPGVAAAGLLPSGVVSGEFLQRLPSVPLDAPLPPGLWVPAVRLDNGSTVVFGRDPHPPLSASLAVQASSTVPWVFRPVAIEGVDHVDGACDSPTHAGLVLDAVTRPDIVIVSSVMSRPGRRPGRVMARRRLADEVARLRAAGIVVVVVEPDADTAALMDSFPGQVDNARARAELIRDHARRAALAALRRSGWVI